MKPSVNLPRLPPPDVLEYADAPAFLKAVLQYRQSKNPRYSFRSFAKGFGLPISTFNSILGGTRKLSAAHSLLISEKLDLTVLEKTYFRLLVERSISNGSSAEAVVKKRIEDTAWLIRAERSDRTTTLGFEPEWYHLALLERASRDDRTTHTALIQFGIRIGLSEEASRDAIRCLLERGAIGEDPDGVVRRNTSRVLLESATSNLVFRRIHEAVTRKALDTLRTQGPEERYSTTEFVSVDTEGFQKLKQLTNLYLDQIQMLSQKTHKRDRLFCVSLHAFQLPPGDPV